MKRINRIVAQFLLAAMLMPGLCFSAEPETNVITHIVIAWLKPEFRTEEYLKKLFEANERLRDIPQVQSIRIGNPIQSDRDRVDDSFDLGNAITFKSVQDMNEYLVHPIHEKFISEFIAGKTAKVVAYDF
ncbi:MAG: hypothetical protein ACI9SC_001272 [Gammaproteobacteria bacterium]